MSQFVKKVGSVLRKARRYLETDPAYENAELMRDIIAKYDPYFFEHDRMYKDFKPWLPDLDEKRISMMGRQHNIPNLSPGTFPVKPFPVTGYMDCGLTRFMVPLVCQATSKTSKPTNVWFVVDTTSPYTCMSAKSLAVVTGRENLDDIKKAFTWSMYIQGLSREFFTFVNVSKDSFPDANILGADILFYWRLSMDVDRRNESFRLVQKPLKKRSIFTRPLSWISAGRII